MDFGLDIMQWRKSMEKLLDLKADNDANKNSALI
jgi:hypothetical protein